MCNCIDMCAYVHTYICNNIGNKLYLKKTRSAKGRSIVKNIFSRANKNENYKANRSELMLNKLLSSELVRIVPSTKNLIKIHYAIKLKSKCLHFNNADIFIIFSNHKMYNRTNTKAKISKYMHIVELIWLWLSLFRIGLPICASMYVHMFTSIFK